ncbi:hypothetical protein [Spirosoma montaniterrae]|nr:hypothetical protein [Spirosoma montaniterrae]
MNELIIGQIVGVSGLLTMAGIILWFLRGIQKDDREINKDWYKRHNM